jgi:aminopeptidase-like protein
MRILQEFIPLETHEVPSGTKVFDWTVPKEWNIEDAYVKTLRGERVVDFKKCNLHVVNYSIPVRAKVSSQELKAHLYSIPEHPKWIPYRTSYYKESWGFCVSHEVLHSLTEPEYEVCIDSSLVEGSLTYGEYFLPGDTDQEILISCHSCHPSLANDNLSGMALCTFLARCMSQTRSRYSYRFLFVPGTIGSITWLARNEQQASKIRHGLVVACVGDSGHMHYKRSRRGDAEIDRVVELVLKHSGKPYSIRRFVPYGYDERQYCSPGFNLAVGSLTRTPNGEYAEYHSSADDLEFIRPEHIIDSLLTYLEVIDALEANGTYRSINPKCEPQLGRRGIYESVGGGAKGQGTEMALLWVLSLADGTNTTLDMAEKAELPFDSVANAIEILMKHGLLERVAGTTEGGE